MLKTYGDKSRKESIAKGKAKPLKPVIKVKYEKTISRRNTKVR